MGPTGNNSNNSISAMPYESGTTVNFNPSNIGNRGGGNGKTANNAPQTPVTANPNPTPPVASQPIGFATENSGIGGLNSFTPGRSIPIFGQDQLDKMVNSGMRFRYQGNPGSDDVNIPTRFKAPQKG